MKDETVLSVMRQGRFLFALRAPAKAGVLFLTRRAGLPSLLPAQENKRNKHS